MYTKASRIKRTVAGLAVSVGLACVDDPAPTDIFAVAEGHFGITVGQADGLWRFGTGYLRGSDCANEPAVTFATGTLVAEDLFAPTVGVTGLCRYGWHSPIGVLPPDQSDLAAHPDIVAIDFEPTPLDLHATGNVAVVSSSISIDVYSTYRARFLDRAGAWEASGQLGTSSVTVVVIDNIVPSTPRPGESWTQSTLPGANGVGRHGLGVARIIEELACPKAGVSPTTCPVKVEAVSAFDSTVYSDGVHEGDSHGDAVSLARAVIRAIDDFGPRPGRLVINLSLGITRDQLLRFPRQAEELRNALAYAVCNGALIIAAGGNDHGFRTSKDFTFPGADVMPVRCGLPAHDSAVAPILAAVAGVKSTNHPLAMNRPIDVGVVHVAAASERAVPDFGSARAPGPLYLVQLTGTSVGAAVVSAAVAATLSVEGGLSRTELQQMFSESGLPIPKLWVGGASSGTMPLIRVLDALEWVCDRYHCSSLPRPYSHSLPTVDPIAEFNVSHPEAQSWSLPPMPGLWPSGILPQIRCVGGPCPPTPIPMDERMGLVSQPPTQPICPDHCDLNINGPVPLVQVNQAPPREFLGGRRTLELSDGLSAYLVPLTVTSSGAEVIDVQNALAATGLQSQDVLQARIIYESALGVSRAEELGIE